MKDYNIKLGFIILSPPINVLQLPYYFKSGNIIHTIHWHISTDTDFPQSFSILPQLPSVHLLTQKDSMY